MKWQLCKYFYVRRVPINHKKANLKFNLNILWKKQHFFKQSYPFLLHGGG